MQAQAKVFRQNDTTKFSKRLSRLHVKILSPYTTYISTELWKSTGRM